MSLLKEAPQASFQMYQHTRGSSQPLEFFYFYPLWYDLWIERIYRAIKRLNLDHTPLHEMQVFLPTPTALRGIIQKIIPSYSRFISKNPAQVREVITYFIRILNEACPEDPWNQCPKMFHQSTDAQKLVEALPWHHASMRAALTVDKLIATTTSLVQALYSDLVTGVSSDCYGPYAVKLKNQGYSFIIRHFHDLQPKELWPEGLLASVREIMVYALYQKTDSSTSSLAYYFIKGRVLHHKRVTALTHEFAHKTKLIHDIVHVMDMEARKEMVMRQECYQLKQLFDAAGMEWQPTPEMLARIKNKPLLAHAKSVPSNIEEYKEAFGINQFAREVIGE